MKSQGDITGRTGDWEDLQPRGEGGANWQVSEARTAGLEDVPPCPPWPILWDITQKYDSNWGYNGLLSPAHSTELYSQNIEGEGIWGRKLWLEICYSRCERRVDSRLTVYSSSMLECEMWDVRYIIIGLIHIGLQDWTPPSLSQALHLVQSQQSSFLLRREKLHLVDPVIRAKWSSI